MARVRWHILQDGDALTLCRHLPPRFDVSSRTVLPACAPLRLAHQVRQDMWRALQNVRGFSPVVRVTPQDGALMVEAGGRAIGVTTGLAARIEAVLEAPARRARWVRFARAGR